MKKIFIDDPVRRHRDEAEVEIAGDRIRFENGKDNYLISFNNEGIRIHKTNLDAHDVLKVIPCASNVIQVI